MGFRVGWCVGCLEVNGLEVGSRAGEVVGFMDGLRVGIRVGDRVGVRGVGTLVGLGVVGFFVTGALVGR